MSGMNGIRACAPDKALQMRNLLAQRVQLICKILLKKLAIDIHINFLQPDGLCADSSA